jgi:hypothetical protein
MQRLPAHYFLRLDEHHWEAAIRRLSSAVACSIAVMSAAAAPADAQRPREQPGQLQRLGGAELQRLLSGATIVLGSGELLRAETYRADGSYEASLVDSAARDGGKWWVDNDRYCFRPGGRKVGCYFVYRGKNQLFREYVIEGRRNTLHLITIQKGGRF